MRRIITKSGWVMAVLLAFALLLAACGGSTSSPAATPTSSSSVSGTFVGQVADSDALIGLASNGQWVIAYVCDGTPAHITLAQWFMGPVTNNAVNVTAKNRAHLVASLTTAAARGSISLNNGKTFNFTASAVAGQSEAGLYRSEQTFGGVGYLGGWIVLPTTAALYTQVTSAAVQLFASWMTPPMLRSGGIINEQTGALLTSPVPDLANRRVTVPNVGSFMLMSCASNSCKVC